ncbi:MAG: tryptophan-rich sensory protein [Rhizobiales bacterium]|nr:tryptophan-rich sensory protein [Hyphomicrobiales bacterium]MBO6697238.1 tryptophan-rich sensory protein [Hyphomicrobiales bacterium]MBO6736507.1 tryptophan-rich sensory protein [Hyphomicrobiales bacterium]MBO6912977.1 tryptophan-rich sensory protein [Hyphomicrobiales bacterium]MBO6954145.1 tryptophan-rich sensory protein [Hyphomicrobiales bacterium]
MDFSISWSLLAFFAVTFAAAMSGGYFRPGDWYRDLAKPSWNPPDFMFPIAWTVLYAMMAVAAWLVWEAVGWPAALVPIGFWLIQLIFNALWSALFFGMKRMDWALIDVALLWLAIVGTIMTFWPISTLAGWLMVPYLAWVSFAAFLNLTILRLNSQQAA